MGGTRNPAAFDAYLHAQRAVDAGGGENYLSAVKAYTDAIHLDPSYALAFAGRSFARSLYAQSATRAEVRAYFDKPLADAHQAAIAPELAEGHLALGFYPSTEPWISSSRSESSSALVPLEAAAQ